MDFEKVLNRILDCVLIALALLVIGLANFVVQMKLHEHSVTGFKYWFISVVSFVFVSTVLFPWDIFRKPMSKEDQEKYYRLM